MDKKVVLITGSSSGLGASTAEVFAKNGYNVVINYLTNERNALKLQKELEEKYKVDCICIQADISEEEDVNYLSKTIIKKFGHSK